LPTEVVVAGVRLPADVKTYRAEHRLESRFSMKVLLVLLGTTKPFLASSTGRSGILIAVELCGHVGSSMLRGCNRRELSPVRHW
jgi:hypothetical protein